MSEDTPIGKIAERTVECGSLLPLCGGRSLLRAEGRRGRVSKTRQPFIQCARFPYLGSISHHPQQAAPAALHGAHQCAYFLIL